MKALTVQQPWAWAIVHGGKDVENRTQAWSYRGPLAIHAGVRLSERGVLSPLVTAALQGNPHQHGPYSPWIGGVVIGLVDLVDVHHQVGSGDRNDCCESPWAEAWYHGRGRLVHLKLANPRPLPVPIPCRGALGLWTPPAEVLGQLEAL